MLELRIAWHIKSIPSVTRFLPSKLRVHAISELRKDTPNCVLCLVARPGEGGGEGGRGERPSKDCLCVAQEQNDLYWPSLFVCGKFIYFLHYMYSHKLYTEKKKSLNSIGHSLHCRHYFGMECSIHQIFNAANDLGLQLDVRPVKGWKIFPYPQPRRYQIQDGWLIRKCAIACQ